MVLLMLGTVLVGSQPRSASAADPFSVIATVDVGINPFGDTISPDGATVWVANSGTVTSNSNKVTVLDASTFAILSRITVGRFPEDIAFAYSGSQASVTNSSDATVSIISTATRSVTQTVSLAPVPMEFPFGIIASRDSTKLFVTSAGGQSDISLQNIAVLNNSNPATVLLDGGIRVQGFTGRSALTPDGALLVVPLSHGGGPPEVLFVDPATNAIVGHLQLLDLMTNEASAR
jgi:YVTN family beta-propeller protein